MLVMILDLDLRETFARDDVGLAICHGEVIGSGLGLGQRFLEEGTEVEGRDEIA
jgi:hypothetical protein